MPGLTFAQDGPYDHSGSYLVPGKTGDPRIVSDLKLYRKICLENHVIPGKHVVVPTKESIKDAVSVGYKFIALGTDFLHLQHGCSQALEVVQNALLSQNGKLNEK